VLTIDPHSVEDVLAAIAAVGAAAGRDSGPVVAALRDRLAAVERAVAGRPRPRVLVLEWTDPPFTAGHWVPELVRRAGGEPVGGVEGGRSVQTTWEDLPEADLCVVAPCGYGLDDALAQSRVVAARLPELPLVAIDSARLVVMGGPGLVDGIEALAWAFHPDAVPRPPPGRISFHWRGPDSGVPS
jgi:iron complex transport system substrate-binding protein